VNSLLSDVLFARVLVLPSYCSVYSQLMRIKFQWKPKLDLRLWIQTKTLELRELQENSRIMKVLLRFFWLFWFALICLWEETVVSFLTMLKPEFHMIRFKNKICALWNLLKSNKTQLVPSFLLCLLVFHPHLVVFHCFG